MWYISQYSCPCDKGFLMSHPRPLFRLFYVFSNKQYNFYNKCDKIPSGIWYWDSNP